MIFQVYDEETADLTDKVAWALCQIIDDDAPLHWTRYRGAAECIATNKKLMGNLQLLGATYGKTQPE